MTDVIIIGAGPAGLNAAVYAARKELSVQVVSTDIGGQMLLTGEIENYLVSAFRCLRILTRSRPRR